MEPSDAELIEFLDLTLSNLDPELREPDVLAMTLNHRRTCG